MGSDNGSLHYCISRTLVLILIQSLIYHCVAYILPGHSILSPYFSASFCLLQIGWLVNCFVGVFAALQIIVNLLLSIREDILSEEHHLWYRIN
jgi:hypothetical protein